VMARPELRLERELHHRDVRLRIHVICHNAPCASPLDAVGMTDCGTQRE
jgi:hypothetical protein